MTVSGKPAGGKMRWFDIEGRPGNAPPIDDYNDEAPSGVAILPAMGIITLTLDDPRTMDPPMYDWATTRVHLATGTGDFTVSAANLVAEGKRLQFSLTDLVPGDDYSIKVINIDQAGNQSSESTYLTTATELVGPYHVNPDTQRGTLIPNGDMNVYTKGDSFEPDGWGIYFGGVWGTTILREAGAGATGSDAVKFTVGAGPVNNHKWISPFVPVRGGEIISQSVILKISSGTGGFPTLGYIWYDEDKVELGGGSGGFVVIKTPNTTYQEFTRPPYELPAAARYVRFMIILFVPIGQDWSLDRMSARLTEADGSIVYTSSTTTFTTAGVPVDIDGAEVAGSVGLAEAAGIVTVAHSGLYDIQVENLSVRNVSAFAQTFTLALQVDYGAGYVTEDSSTVVIGAFAVWNFSLKLPALRQLTASDTLKLVGTNVTGSGTINIYASTVSTMRVFAANRTGE